LPSIPLEFGYNRTFVYVYSQYVNETFAKAPLCPISASGSNFDPQNTQCIPACPVGPSDRTERVKILAFLELLKKKIDIFQRSFNLAD
jgi:hypothetical protein